MSNATYEVPDPKDLEQVAECAGLHYVSDDEPGFTRQRRGRGFTYFHPDGERVQDPQLRERFEGLVIPPAWTEVWICTQPAGHIQATGRDAKGRKQYIYHPGWDEVRNQAKFSRLAQFGRALPRVRARVQEDLGERRMTRRKVVALVVRLLGGTLIRVGNPEYARQNGSYGLTTLLNEHIDVSGSTLRFSFQGKSGKEQEVDLKDRRLARLVKRCQELPGQELFQYVDEDGGYQRVSSGDVNRYLKEVTGQDFTAKDFRTWGGTVLAAVELYQAGPAETQTEEKRKITQAIKQVATELRNTPAICRKYYVHPAVLQAYSQRSLFEVMAGALAAGEVPVPGLSLAECAVLEILDGQEVTDV